MYILYRLILKYLTCVCEVAWSAVCLHSKPVLSCIDFTVFCVCSVRSVLPSPRTNQSAVLEKPPNVLVINQIFQAVPPVKKL